MNKPILAVAGLLFVPAAYCAHALLANPTIPPALLLPSPAAAAPAPAPAAGGAIVFELTGSAKMVHLEGPEIPGAKPFKNSANIDMITECILGNDPTCAGKIETDAGGKAYLLFDSLTSWRLATNAAGVGATVLTGQTDPKGGFMMTGTHLMSNTSFLLSGKV